MILLLLIAAVGFCTHVFVAHPKLSNVGLVTFGCAAFALLTQFNKW